MPDTITDAMKELVHAAQEKRKVYNYERILYEGYADSAKRARVRRDAAEQDYIHAKDAVAAALDAIE